MAKHRAFVDLASLARYCRGKLGEEKSLLKALCVCVFFLVSAGGMIEAFFGEQCPITTLVQPSDASSPEDRWVDSVLIPIASQS